MGIMMRKVKLEWRDLTHIAAILKATLCFESDRSNNTRLDIESSSKSMVFSILLLLFFKTRIALLLIDIQEAKALTDARW